MRIDPSIPSLRPRHNQSGFATLIIIVILSILLIYLMGNVRTLHYLGRDLHLIEVQQQRRVQRQVPLPSARISVPAPAGITNNPSGNSVTNSAPR
jgi:hypothetical protein